MDIYNIKTYFKYENQKKAIVQAMKYGISKKKFLEMKKNAGFTNWTFEKRKYKKELELKEFNEEKDNKKQLDIYQEEDNIIILEEIDYDNNEDLETPYNIWSNEIDKNI